MKNFLLAGAMLLSFNAFSQSYLVLNNGVTLTTDKSGFIYDFGNFILPYKVLANGGNFLIAEERLSTVDEHGFFYTKSEKIKKYKAKGQNYFINDDNDLVTIDSKGFFYVLEDKAFKKAKSFGGNYFTVKPEDKKPGVDLYTVSSTGNYFKLNVEGLNPADIVVFGGTYFQTRTGMTYTVTKDGFVYAKPEVKVKAIKRTGGNFFIDANNFLYTVSEEGFLVLPVLPANIKVSQIAKLGSNYMIDNQGRIFVVDKTGALYERTIDHDLLNTKVLSF
ncbi:hypothetical protein ACJVC5_08895 [Peredibacter sp. HCB2-198]|uniref:hypothetical protein n=1 Tax=Peredibacter sp. HCB2-198 TaxID=3383025 RepID=UPI0038B60FE4